MNEYVKLTQISENKYSLRGIDMDLERFEPHHIISLLPKERAKNWDVPFSIGYTFDRNSGFNCSIEEGDFEVYIAESPTRDTLFLDIDRSEVIEYYTGLLSHSELVKKVMKEGKVHFTVDDLINNPEFGFFLGGIKYEVEGKTYIGSPCRMNSSEVLRFDHPDSYYSRHYNEVQSLFPYSWIASALYVLQFRDRYKDFFKNQKTLEKDLKDKLRFVLTDVIGKEYDRELPENGLVTYKVREAINLDPSPYYKGDRFSMRSHALYSTPYIHNGKYVDVGCMYAQLKYNYYFTGMLSDWSTATHPQFTRTLRVRKAKVHFTSGDAYTVMFSGNKPFLFSAWSDSMKEKYPLFRKGRYLDGTITFNDIKQYELSELEDDTLNVNDLCDLISRFHKEIIDLANTELSVNHDVENLLEHDPITEYETNKEFSFDSYIASTMSDGFSAETVWDVLLASAHTRAEGIKQDFDPIGRLVHLSIEQILFLIELAASHEAANVKLVHFKNCVALLHKEIALTYSDYADHIHESIVAPMSDILSDLKTKGFSPEAASQVQELVNQHNELSFTIAAAHQERIARAAHIFGAKHATETEKVELLEDPVLTLNSIHDSVLRHYHSLRDSVSGLGSDFLGGDVRVLALAAAGYLIGNFAGTLIKDAAKVVWLVIKQIGEKVYKAGIYIDNVKSLWYLFGEHNYSTQNQWLSRPGYNEKATLIPLECLVATSGEYQKLKKQASIGQGLYVNYWKDGVRKRALLGEYVKRTNGLGSLDICILAYGNPDDPVFKHKFKFGKTFSWDEILRAFIPDLPPYVHDDFSFPGFMATSQAVIASVALVLGSITFSKSSGDLISSAIRTALVVGASIALNEYELFKHGNTSGVSFEWGFMDTPRAFSYLTEGYGLFAPDRFLFARKASSVMMTTSIVYHAASIAFAIGVEAYAAHKAKSFIKIPPSVRFKLRKISRGRSKTSHHDNRQASNAISTASAFDSSIANTSHEFQSAFKNHVNSVKERMHTNIQHLVDKSPAGKIKDGVANFGASIEKKLGAIGLKQAKNSPKMIAGLAKTAASSPLNVGLAYNGIVKKKRLAGGVRTADALATSILDKIGGEVAPALDSLLSKTKSYTG